MNVSDYFRSKLYHPKCPALMSTCRYQSQLGDWHWQKCPHGWCIELMWPEAHPIWPLMTLQTHWDDQASNPFHYMGWASIHAVSLPQALGSSDALHSVQCTQTFKWHQIQSEHMGTWTKSKREKGHLLTWVNWILIFPTSRLPPWWAICRWGILISRYINIAHLGYNTIFLSCMPLSCIQNGPNSIFVSNK